MWHCTLVQMLGTKKRVKFEKEQMKIKRGMEIINGRLAEQKKVE